MEPAIPGIVLHSSVLIALERRQLKPAQVIEDVVQKAGTLPIILSTLPIFPIVNVNVTEKQNGAGVPAQPARP
jgi:hypothetical protein